MAPSDPEPTEQLEALRRAIGRLPAKQRQVVMMHYLEELVLSTLRVIVGLCEVG